MAAEHGAAACEIARQYGGNEENAENYPETMSVDAETVTPPTFWEALREEFTSWKSIAIKVVSTVGWLLVYYLTGSILAVVAAVAFVVLIVAHQWAKNRRSAGSQPAKAAPL